MLAKVEFKRPPLAAMISKSEFGQDGRGRRVLRLTAKN